MTTRLPATALLCLVIGFGCLTLATGGQQISSDDSDGWLGTDEIGLGGGDWTGDFAESQEPSPSSMRPDGPGLPDRDFRPDFASGDSQPEYEGEFSEYDVGGYDDGDSGYEDSESGYDNGESGYDNSEYGYEDSDYGYGEGEYGYDEGEYGYDSEYGYEDSNEYYYDDSEFGYDDSDFGYDDNEYGYDDSDFGYDDNEYGYGDSDFGYDDNEYGFDDSDFGYDDSEYGFDDSEYGFDDSDFGYDDSEYGFEDSEYGYDNSDYGYDDSDSDYGDFDEEFGNYEDDFDFRERPSRRYRGGRRGRGRRGRYDRSVVARSVVEDDGREAEFDDSSADPSEIPSGYFGPETGPPRGGRGGSGGGGRGRGVAVASGSINFPGFRLVISEASQWWKHNINVCLHKEILRPREIAGADIHMSMYTVGCMDVSMSQYTCNVTQWNGSVTTAHSLTYACCRGYTRLRGDRGCPRKVMDSPARNMSFGALLRQHGYSQKIIDLFNTVLTNEANKDKQWTVFMPEKAALNVALRRAEEGEASEQPVPEWFVRTVLNHFAQPAMSVESMRSGQKLPTLIKAEAGGGIFVTKTRRGGPVLANCQPLVLANQPFSQYSLVHFTANVLTTHRSNLYQLMLQRLQAVVSAETAAKLLAPIRSTLTGKNPLSVFMHLPSRDEMENNCYVRNLRSAIVNGAECNASISTCVPLRTIDGKLLRITNTPSGLLIDGNRLLTSSDHMASNGVLHIVNATESLTGFANEITRRLKSSAHFKPLFTAGGSNRTEGSGLALLIPPHNGTYTYANTSARWDNVTELVRFGRVHLLNNATALRRTVRLAMLDGVRRDFVQLFERQPAASIFGPPGRLMRHLFVDCVRVVQSAKDCGGTVYFLLKKELPDFSASPTTLSYLSGRKDFRMARKIVQFALTQNVTGLADRIGSSDAALVLLKDADMHRLTGGLLSRRRRPTREQMVKLTTWFARYFVASKQICAVKSVMPYVTVPIFRIDRRPCRSIICSFRRRVSGELRRVKLEGRLPVREGFLLSGKAMF